MKRLAGIFVGPLHGGSFLSEAPLEFGKQQHLL